MLEISIGALSHRTGLPVSTIRFYDDNGLIQSNRNGGGHRRFERAQIRRVSFIIAAQKFGYTLPQIKTLLDSLPNERTPTVEDWAQLSEKFRKSLDEKIENLRNLPDTLSDCIGCGCLSMKSCGLHNPQDVLGQDGPGPRRLAL
jgi:MerR family redox-sensitive transcriptional activator SoxR